MSHTFVAKQATTFISDGDPRGGEVIIKNFRIDPDNVDEVIIPYDDMAAFVANQILNKKIAALEQMTPQQILDSM